MRMTKQTNEVEKKNKTILSATIIMVILLALTLTMTLSVGAADPGASCKLTIDSGKVADQTITSSKQITVNASQSISGSLKISLKNAYSANIIVPIAATPNWGSNKNSYWGVEDWASTGTNSYTVPVSLNAPSSTGTYYIIIAARGEKTYAQVMSATNWEVNEVHWDDGNDIADWSSSTISMARSNGVVQAEWEMSGGTQTVYVPADALKIVVQSGSTGNGQNGYNETQSPAVVKVVDSKSNPIVGANVMFGTHSGNTDAYGTITFIGLAPNDYTLSVSADGYSTYSNVRTLNSGGNTFTVVLVKKTSSESKKGFLPGFESLPIFMVMALVILLICRRRM